MPTISEFFGIIIRMFFNEHLPPHFHAQYGEYEGMIGLNLKLISFYDPGPPSEAISSWTISLSIVFTFFPNPDKRQRSQSRLIRRGIPPE